MMSMDISALQSSLEQAQSRISLLEQENAALRQEIRWIDKLLAVPASVMSPSQKVTLRAAAKAIRRQAPNDQEMVQIESWKLCKTVGQSKDTFLDNLTYLSEKVGALRKHTQRVVSEDGAYTTNLYIGATNLIARPEQYRVEKPRNHGGERLLCPHCQSDRLQKKVIITCMGCGAILDEHASLVNRDEPEAPGMPGTVILQKRQVADADPADFFAHEQSNLTMDITRNQDGQVDDPGEQGTPNGEVKEQEPISPPMLPADADPGQAQDNPAELMQDAAALLVEIAGPEPVHIEMASRGPAKYYEVKQAFGLQDASNHLAGKKTKGAMLRRPDGKTRALCYDADTDSAWQVLREAAHFLQNAGYVPLVEDSPAGRGGHLWIIYNDLVDARCAHRHVYEIAPMLQEIKERWPSPDNHKVRLPGGIYVKPGFRQQCKLYDAIGGLVADNRRDAARALLTMQTPVGIVPIYPPDPAPDPGQHSATRRISEEEAFRGKHQNQLPPAGREPDTRWQQKYHQHLWFQFTPQQLAAWYNERHSIEELLPSERNGMGLASWRGERTASVGYTKDGQGWVDFGASTKRSDGKQDGGDALELEARISEQSKPEIMRQVARDLVKEARAALESAARRGEPPPAWVQEFMTPAGWAYYWDLRNLAQPATIITNEKLSAANIQAPLFAAESAVSNAGGVTGFHMNSPSGVPSGPYPAPVRASYCCRSTSWIWNAAEARYVCGVCQGKPEQKLLYLL